MMHWELFVFLRQILHMFPRKPTTAVTDSWLQMPQLPSHCHHAEMQTYWAQKGPQQVESTVITKRKISHVDSVFQLPYQKRINPTNKSTPKAQYLHFSVRLAQTRNETAISEQQIYLSSYWVRSCLWCLNVFSICMPKHMYIACKNPVLFLRQKDPSPLILAADLNLTLKVDLRFLQYVIWISQHWSAQVPNESRNQNGCF